MKKTTLVFFLLAFISLAAYVSVAAKPYTNRLIEEEYAMAQTLMQGKNPYQHVALQASVAHPYPIVNYLVYIPFVSIIHDPRAVKLTEGILGWAIGIMIFLAYKNRREGLARALLYWGTYHFYIAFARFSITEPAMLFFTILGLLLLTKKHVSFGLSGILAATFTKYVPAVVFPFLFISQPKLRRPIIVTLVVTLCIVITLTIANPWFVASIMAHSSASGQALRLDNISLFSSSFLPISKYPLLEKILPVAMGLGFLSMILFLLAKIRTSQLPILASYLFPVSAWLIFPPNNFLWGNFYFWNSIVLLLVPYPWAIRMYIFYLVPEYLLKAGNIYPYPTRSILYGATYLTGALASICVIKNSIIRPTGDTHTSRTMIFMFFFIQALFILLIGLLRKNIFWFI